MLEDDIYIDICKSLKKKTKQAWVNLVNPD
jgi:hypothetical protein